MPGGGRPEDIGVVLLGGRTGGVAFRVKDVGPYPPYGADPGHILAQGRTPDLREEAKAAGGWDMGVYSAGGSDGGSFF